MGRSEPRRDGAVDTLQFYDRCCWEVPSMAVAVQIIGGIASLERGGFLESTYRSLSIPTKTYSDHVCCHHDMCGWLGIGGLELELLAWSWRDRVMATAALDLGL